MSAPSTEAIEAQIAQLQQQLKQAQAAQEAAKYNKDLTQYLAPKLPFHPALGELVEFRVWLPLPILVVYMTGKVNAVLDKGILIVRDINGDLHTVHPTMLRGPNSPAPYMVWEQLMDALRPLVVPPWHPSRQPVFSFGNLFGNPSGVPSGSRPTFNPNGNLLSQPAATSQSGFTYDPQCAATSQPAFGNAPTAAAPAAAAPASPDTPDAPDDGKRLRYSVLSKDDMAEVVRRAVKEATVFPKKDDRVVQIKLEKGFGEADDLATKRFSQFE